jgi:cell division protein FtsQ
MNALVRLLAWLFALAVVILPVVAVLNGWFASERWPLTQLRVSAEFQRVSAEQVQAAARPHLGSGFFAVDLAEVHASLAALPWVERVVVRKQWPDTLEILITEHRAIARWGEGRLLAETGVLFEVPGIDGLQGLPQFEGPEAHTQQLMDMYRQSQGLLAGLPKRIEWIQLSPRGSWSMGLNDGAELMLGRIEPLPRLQRLVAALPELLRAEARPLLRADLRYANGFALRWAAPDTDSTAAPRQQI